MKDTDGVEWTNASFVKAQNEIKKGFDGFLMQSKYVEVLLLATGYGSKEGVIPSEYITTINKLYKEKSTYKITEPLCFRDYAHRSGVTQNMALMPHASKKWLENRGDETVTIEYFLNITKE